MLSTLLTNRVPLMDALGLARASVIAPGRRARLDEVSRNVFAHPTLSEAVKEAVEGIAGHMINL